MRYTVADLPESGRWLVIRSADDRVICDAATEAEAHQLARVLDARRLESVTYLSATEREEARKSCVRLGWLDDADA